MIQHFGNKLIGICNNYGRITMCSFLFITFLKQLKLVIDVVEKLLDKKNRMFRRYLFQLLNFWVRFVSGLRWVEHIDEITNSKSIRLEPQHSMRHFLFRKTKQPRKVGAVFSCFFLNSE